MRLIYVDGYKIRQVLDPDFNVLHTSNHDRIVGDAKWYIPAGEIWLDYHFKDEEDFLVEVETAVMTDYSCKAYRKFLRKGQPRNLVSKTNKRGRLTIQWIDGAQVRLYIDPQFLMGGHDLIYDYIPEKTVWIEQKLDPRDVPHVLKHEIVERKLMAKGKGYDDAHDFATAAEKESRRAAGGAYPIDNNFDRNLKLEDFHVKKTTKKKERAFAG